MRIILVAECLHVDVLAVLLLLLERFVEEVLVRLELLATRDYLDLQSIGRLGYFGQAIPRLLGELARLFAAAFHRLRGTEEKKTDFFWLFIVSGWEVGAFDQMRIFRQIQTFAKNSSIFQPTFRVF